MTLLIRACLLFYFEAISLGFLEVSGTFLIMLGNYCKVRNFKYFKNLDILQNTSSLKGLNFRSSPLNRLLGKGVLKLCSKFAVEHPCRSVISVKLLCNFIEITLRHEGSPVNLLHIFRIFSEHLFLRTPLEGCF